MVEPTGVPTSIEIKIPAAAQMRDIITEQIITLLKLLKTRIAERAGKIISADMRSEPTKFIAMTIMTAMTTAMRRLYISERKIIFILVPKIKNVIFMTVHQVNL